MTPKISVVIPVYNVEKYLRDCLDSVLAQTHRDFEAVCVNDGSTDGSAAILAEYAARDARIRIADQPNRGLSAARNAGLDLAAGKYVFFLDSDDCLAPGALERLISVAALFELDLLHFDREVFYEEGSEKDPYEEQDFFKGTYPEDAAESGEAHFVRRFRNKDFQCAVWTRFFRMDFLRKNALRFHEGILHEDEAFSVMADVLAERVMSIPDKLCRRRVRAGSIMTGLSAERHLAGCAAAWTDLSAFLDARAETLAPDVRDAVRVRLATLMLSAEKYRKNIAGDMPEACREIGGVPLERRIAAAEQWLKDREAEEERAGRTAAQKLFAPLKCLRENGLAYTLKRIFGGRK